MFVRNHIIKNCLLHCILICVVFSDKISANICQPIEDANLETRILYDRVALRKFLDLTKNDKESYQYLEYDEVTFDDNPLPHSQIHTMVSGGDQSFSLLTKANHEAYARARGINYRHVIPEEYAQQLGNKRQYWLKVFVLNDLLHCDNIPDGSWIMWLDDDFVINDFTQDMPIPDQYIQHFSDGYSLLVTNDVCKTRLNTGLILVKKNDTTRIFVKYQWLYLSVHPIHGYKGQSATLHEQEVLRNLMYHSTFTGVNDVYQVIKVVPSRDKDLNMNTFKREDFVKAQGWDNITNVCDSGNDKKWRDGDYFVHCGARNYKTKIIIHTLKQLFDNDKNAIAGGTNKTECALNE